MGSSTSATPDPSTQGAGRGYSPNVNSPDPQQQASAVAGPVSTSTLLPGSGISTSNAGGDVTVSTAGGVPTSIVGGTGISVANAGGVVTVTNTGVTSLVAGVGVTVSGSGAVTVNTAPLAQAYEQQLTDTNLDTVTSVVVAAAGVYQVRCYFRVVTATTTVTLQVTWTDATGSQTSVLVNAASEGVGSYSIMPLNVAAAAGSTITVQAQAGTANQVYVSASIVR